MCGKANKLVTKQQQNLTSSMADIIINHLNPAFTHTEKASFQNYFNKL